MSNPSLDLKELIPAWVATTSGARIPTPPAAETLDSRLLELRGRLRHGQLTATDMEIDDEKLAVFSRLCFELSTSATEDRSSRFREAETAYELISGSAWSSDYFDERQDILCDLSLAAWRNARLSCSAKVAAKWQRRYQVAVVEAGAMRESLELLLSRCTRLPTRDLANESFLDARTVFALSALMWELLNASPASVVETVLPIRELIASMDQELFEADERAFLLAYTALLASGAFRHVGELVTSGEWWKKAELLARATANPDPLLAKCSYAHLALLYDSRRYDEALASVAAVRQRFLRLEMEEDATLCDFVEAMALKGSGNTKVAFAKFSALRSSLSPTKNAPLFGYVAANIGALLSSEHRYAEAFDQYRTALSYIRKANHPWMIAILKADIGETLRDCGQLSGAIEAFRESVSDYAALGMKTFVAYIRVVLAETLLLADRPREAEIEVLAALPTIEAEHMVEEGFAALKLLRESVDKSKTDAASLRALRERLKGDGQ
jgi:tetratricopeptide (TPR) repeat protein